MKKRLRIYVISAILIFLILFFFLGIFELTGNAAKTKAINYRSKQSPTSLLTKQCGSGFCQSGEICCSEGKEVKGSQSGYGFPGGGTCCNANTEACDYNSGAEMLNIPPVDYCNAQKKGCQAGQSACGTYCCDDEKEWCSLQSISFNNVPFFAKPLVKMFAKKQVGFCYPKPDKTCPAGTPYECGSSGSKEDKRPNVCCQKKEDCKLIKDSKQNGIDICQPSECPEGFTLSKGTSGTPFAPGGIFNSDLCCNNSESVPGNYPNGQARCIQTACKMKVSATSNPQNPVQMINPEYTLSGSVRGEGNCSGRYTVYAGLYPSDMCPENTVCSKEVSEGETFTLGPFSTSGHVQGGLICNSVSAEDTANTGMNSNKIVQICVQPCNDLSFCDNGDEENPKTAYDIFGEYECSKNACLINS